MYSYEGNISSDFFSLLLEHRKQYESDRDFYIKLQRDNEKMYQKSYARSEYQIRKNLASSTNLIFSSIENAVATANENFPSPNILPRSEAVEDSAAVLSKIIPVILDLSDFKRIYKANMRTKAKFGTAVYFISADETNESIRINRLNFTDVFCDCHVDNVQDSKFLFIESAVDNDILKKQFPHLASLFEGDAEVTSLGSTESFCVKNSSIITDAYYKLDGKLHLIEYINDEIIFATEDLPGYENGLYDHGLYPVVFDRQFPIAETPFGFGFIDIAKSTQITIDKLDDAILKNLMINSNPRFLSPRNGGIDMSEFLDSSKNVVHYDGDFEGIKAIQGVLINGTYLAQRDTKKDELKELCSNRDFQQGDTNSGVQAASAILALQQAGEKRARLMSDDSYDSFKDIIFQVIELMRQFFNSSHSFRITNEKGKRDFIDFDKSMLFDGSKPALFDIEIVAQKENPYSREMFNNTILSFWNSGMLNPANFDAAKIAVGMMQFDGKEQLLSELEDAYDSYMKKQSEAAAMQQPAQAPADASSLEASVPASDDPGASGSSQDFIKIPLG